MNYKLTIALSLAVLAILLTTGTAMPVFANSSQQASPLQLPYVNPQNGGVHAFINPFPIIIDFGISPANGRSFESIEPQGEVTLTLVTLDGSDVLSASSTTDGKRWRLLIPNIQPGDHTLVFNARDEAGRTLASDTAVRFTVRPIPAFPIELVPGWNLISFPGQLAASSIDTVFAPNVPVTTVFQFDPAVPGGWRGAFRDQVADPLIFGPFVGDLDAIDAAHGYWVYSLTHATMGVVLTSTPGGPFGGLPVVPASIDVYRGWNLVPVFDVTASLDLNDVVDADAYFVSLGDDISRILTYDSLTSQWINIVRDGIVETGTQEQLTFPGTPGACATCPLNPNERLQIGKAYWIFASTDTTLVP